MMILRKLLLWLVCWAAAVYPSLAQSPTDGVRQVPFDFADRQIGVDVLVEGQGPFRMHLDTGVYPSAVDETVAERLQTRLLQGRRELDNAIARFGGELAGAIAALTKSGDTDTLQRSIYEELLRTARTDETFENRLHEIAPLVQLYCQLATALGL